MKKIITILVGLWAMGAAAQSVTGINPNQAYKGQSIPTTITSSGLFTTSSSPQGNIQDIILKTATDSTFAIYDSTQYINANTAKTYWNIPSSIGAGLYNLIVRIYNSVTHTTTDHALNNSFTILSPAIISGTVYRDLNKNGLKDAGEPGIAGKKILLTPANTFVISDYLGNYSINAMNGLDTIAIKLLSTDGYRVWTAPSYYLNVTGTNITNQDFGLIDTALVSINPNQAIAGTQLLTTITSNGLFTVGSSPQGNIMDILLYNGNMTVHAISDSTHVISTTIAQAFWSIPLNIATGLYDLIVSAYNNFTHITSTYSLYQTFTILAPSTISGTVYRDLNLNGIKDAGEPGIAGKKILLSPIHTFVVSDYLGNYTINAPNGIDTVTINLTPSDVYHTSGVTSYSTTVMAGNAILNKNFGLFDTTLVSINPNQAEQGQYIGTTITSNGLFMIGSTPQGNIQQILLQNSSHSFSAIWDSTKVVSNNLAHTFWNVPIGIATGLYDLVVTIYDFVLQASRIYTLSNAFHVLAASVWPGDADANHVADNADLLAIGLAYDSIGTTRSGASIVWQAQGATDWLDTLPSGANFKHADCNGDGIVNANDTAAILQNFSLTHNKNSGITAWRSGIPGISLQLSKDTVVNGDTVTVRLLLGDSTTSVSNIYGVAFDFNYDPIPFDSTTAAFSFSPSWFGNSNNSISIHKDFRNSGTIKAAITGINHLNRSGLGEIARFRAVITTGNINGKNLSYYKELFYISNIKTTDIHGNAIPLNGAVDSNKVGYIPTGITDIKYSEQIYVSPNPANTRLQVSSSVSLKDIAIIDVTGRVVFTSSMTDSRLTKSIDISSIEQGIYFVLVTTQRGKGLSKIVVSR